MKFLQGFLISKKFLYYNGAIITIQSVDNFSGDSDDILKNIIVGN